MLNTIVSAMILASGASSTELTVYNQGFALVKETRQLEMRQGRQEVRVEDVAERIEPTSVAIRSLSAPGSFTVLEQNYQYDLISVQAILAKAVGREITLTRTLPNGSAEVVRGTLMSAPTQVVGGVNGSQMTYNGMVVRTSDNRILLNPSGEVSVDCLPDGLISKPTLVWDLEARQGGRNQVELSYLTQGISWASDYVLALEQDGKVGDFKGWVTLNNQSGATFVDAKLKLLAGDVRRARNEMAEGGTRGVPMAAKADAGFAQEAFADYHLYTLQRPATVRNREIKQVSLLEAFAVPVTKRLVVDPMASYRGWMPQEGEVGTGPMKPQVRIEFKNDQASKLGMPLPMGTVKVFQRDSGGSLQMLGEARIDHTPRNETLSLVVGSAFDVVVERKRTQYTALRNAKGEVRGAKETFEIEVRNRKETAESVTLIERFWGEFTISAQTLPSTKLDANTFQFVVSLKANEVKTVRFTVETRW